MWTTMASKTIKSPNKKQSKNQIRRERAKLERKAKNETPNPTNTPKPKTEPKPIASSDNVELEITGDENDQLLNSFKDIFKKFEVTKDVDEEEVNQTTTAVEKYTEINENETQKQTQNSDSTKDNENGILSKRQRKKLYSIPLYILKAESKNPELVEWMDVNSPDPRLHIYLKTLQNSVGVPIHWNTKKSFLSTKRAIERPPFQLPDFILETGILEMRDTSAETEDQSTLKQRMRERVQPKSGQLDIDYEKLYDAFFKFQKKPFLLKFGKLFSEHSNLDDLKFKDQLSKVKVGTLSRNLKHALGMIDENGNVISKFPPWIQTLEDIGPPPSYPNMKISASGQISVNTLKKNKRSSKPWGALINDLDFEEKDTSKRQSLEEEEPEAKFDKSRGDILLNTFGDDPAKYQNLSKTVKKPNNEDPRLFKVLQSTDSSGASSLFGSKTSSYKI